MANKELSSLFVRLGLDDRDFKAGLNFIQSSLTGVVSKVTLIAAAVAVAGAIFEFAKTSVQGFVAAGVEIGNMATQTGFSTQALSKLKYAADISGGSLNDIGIAMKGVANSLETARTGTGATAKAFQELGLNVTQLMSMSPEGQFMAIANAISAVEDPTMRAALAVDIFGRSGTALLPILDNLSIKLGNANKYAYVFTPEETQRAQNANTAFKNLGTSATSLKDILGSDLAPAATVVANAFADYLAYLSLCNEATLYAIKYFLGFKQAVDGTSGSVKDAVTNLKDFADAANGGFSVWQGQVIKSTRVGPSAETPLKFTPYALGGIAMRPTIGMIGESGPEAVIPLDRMGGVGGGNTYVFNIPGVMSDGNFAELVRQKILDTQRRNGNSSGFKP